MRVAVAGWFSFPEMGASAGDVLCLDLISSWLTSHGVVVDVCAAPPFQIGADSGRRGTVDWSATNPRDYAAVVFVCGPFGNGWPIPEFLAHFRGVRTVGVNLTMLQDLREWNPFDVLFERDSSRTTTPDLVFLTPPVRTPVAGLVLVHRQKEYGDRCRHDQADQALRRVAEVRSAAIVPIDTRLDRNATGLTSSAQVESLIARTDIILTTRLHGMVLALHSGIAPLVVDPIAGGAKVERQARAIEWPFIFRADGLDDRALLEAFDVCCSPAGRQLAAECAAKARQKLSGIEQQLIASVAGALLREV
jgi:hypothetical protein